MDSLTKQKLINDLTEIQTLFFDEESKLLANINEPSEDYYGNKMRRIEDIRRYQSTIVDAIDILKES